MSVVNCHFNIASFCSENTPDVVYGDFALAACNTVLMRVACFLLFANGFIEIDSIHIGSVTRGANNCLNWRFSYDG